MKKSLLCLFLFAAFQASAQNYSLGLLGTSSQAVNIGTGAAITGTGGFTVEAWVKTTATADAYIVQQREGGGAGFEGEYMLSLTTSGQVSWFIYQGGNGFNVVSTATVNDGNWHHIAATREADASGRIYIDGVLDQSSAGTVATMNALTVAIGYDFRDANKYFTGDIEDVRIWNTTRTAFQIKEFAYKAPANNAAGLVAYYKCDENGGTTLVNSCTNTPGINGTIVNGSTWNASQKVFGFNALNFDGVNDVVTTTQSLSGMAAFTIEGWIFPTTAGTRISFFGQDEAIEFGFADATTIRGWTATANPPGNNEVSWTFNGGTFPLNTWHHVAFTGDGTNTRLIVDGVQRAIMANAPANYGTSGNPFTIGGDVWDPASGYFSGTIDEVRVWNVARTPAQIQAAMMTELNPASEPALIGYYTFNQGTAGGTNTLLPVVIDQSGNFKGTPANFAFTGATTNYVAQNPGFASLPVSWISFTAQKQGEKVVLNWSTAAEEDAKDFVVEHSTDAIHWKQVGTVAAKNTAAANSYQYTHNFPDQTLNFYRLQQRDQNGRSAISKTVSVRFAGVARPLIYANPISNGILSVRMEQAGQVQLFTQQGQMVVNKQLGAGIQQINVAHLAKGVYMVKFNNLTASVIIQ